MSWAAGLGIHGGGNSAVGQLQHCREPPPVRRVLSDISNTVQGSQGLGIGAGLAEGPAKRSPLLLEPRTPARRAKGFTVFEDSATASASRQAPSPPHLLPKSRVAADAIEGLHRHGPGDGICDIEEVMPSEPPDIQSFADPVSVQDQYWRALAMDGPPDGHGRPEDLADALSASVFEASRQEALHWNEQAFLSPRSVGSSMRPLSWSAMPSPPPASIGAMLGFGACPGHDREPSSPLSPPSMNMDVDSDIDSDEEQSGGAG